MARPWRVSLVDRTASSSIATTGPDINNSNSATGDRVSSPAQRHISSSAVASFSNSNGEDSLHGSFDHNNTVGSARNIESDNPMFLPAFGQLTIATTQAPTHTSASPFARLPGEIRNRIFRAYFDMFAEETAGSVIFRPTAARFLNVLHVNHTFRSEAGSIFDTEYLCTDSFAVVGYFQDALWLRIKSMCALIAIRNVHLHVSITCTMRSGPPYTDRRFRCLRAVEQQGLDVDRITLRRDFATRLWQFICYDMRIERFNHFFQPAQGRQHPFFPGKIDLGTETFMGHGYVLDCEEYRDLTDDTVDTTIRISGRLAELHWPECDWRDLAFPQSYGGWFT